MAQRDGLNNMQVVHLGNVTLSGTTAATSSYVDTRGFDKVTIQVVANTVTDAGTASGFTVTFQDSADTAAASAAAVTAANAVNDTLTLTVTSDSTDNTVIGGFGYIGADRYVGISAVGTTGTDADLSVIAILECEAQQADLIGTAVART